MKKKAIRAMTRQPQQAPHFEVPLVWLGVGWRSRSRGPVACAGGLQALP